ncbi:pre-mRNA-splicing factor 38A isoform X2 [Lingula anatina]|uniref:Pre-mRNA-splicing factor 38 n=1 Tax=Lingula anatina TaxID=7574 RepID=A0A1S3KDP3_LINAN|nr:pre-mRNA-splicing factor 38A isoform X1 [Lingula anatina]XP_013420746.1 pre-mRNA-splicing factor 38A isoform X2 [Lingula anatina]|eukprot:XP_013420745.1 pre-mRNA-splicing factor 38A isoform X1 [Lingula anatina]
MANRTVKDAVSIKGTNPQYLVEKIIRTRIYECRYWKEECFALTAELLVDKAMELKYVGGVFGGNIKPTPFLCLVLKMLQIQPEKDIVVEFIRNEDFKYVRALGALYMRLIGTSLDCYKYLEPLYNDFRKMKQQDRMGNFSIIHMDEFIDSLLREERVCDIILPRIQKRAVFEDNNELDPRVSALEDDMEDMESSDEGEIVENDKRSPTPERKRGNYRDLDQPRDPPSPRYRRSSRSPARRRRSRSRDRDRDQRRRRSRSRERRHKSPSHRHKHRDEDDKHKRHKKSKRSHRSRSRSKERSKKTESSSKSSKEDLEIKEANELRAKLGLAPLRP